jgi:CRISPR-associated Cas5-like protein
MVWVSAKYRFASTFSYRIPHFSSSYALTAPAPSPSTIKLAIIATTINRTGDIERGKNLFKKIHSAKVAIEVPNKIVFFKAFMKRLKKKRKEELLYTPFGIITKRFESTFGIREYVLYNGPLTIYLNIPEEARQETLKTLTLVQYLGTSDSLCYCLETSVKSPSPTNCTKLCELEKVTEKGIIFLLSDFTEKISFDSVNPYSSKKIRKEDLTLVPYLFPIQIVKKDKNCTIYQRL